MIGKKMTLAALVLSFSVIAQADVLYYICRATSNDVAVRTARFYGDSGHITRAVLGDFETREEPAISHPLPHGGYFIRSVRPGRFTMTIAPRYQSGRGLFINYPTSKRSEIPMVCTRFPIQDQCPKSGVAGTA